MQLTEIIETTVSGLGYELVDIERAGGGLLRISIDQPAGIAIEDCEKVTRQLQYLFEVENIDYSRLEVGSPGLDHSTYRKSNLDKALRAAKTTFRRHDPSPSKTWNIGRQ